MNFKLFLFLGIGLYMAIINSDSHTLTITEKLALIEAFVGLIQKIAELLE
jgi:hypothetical protein